MDPAVNTLVKALASDVRASLTRDELEDAIRLNESSKDQMTCHTHDFYDANESLFAAFE